MRSMYLVDGVDGLEHASLREEGRETQMSERLTTSRCRFPSPHLPPSASAADLTTLVRSSRTGGSDVTVEVCEVV